jgi:hypothetical protein
MQPPLGYLKDSVHPGFLLIIFKPIIGCFKILEHPSTLFLALNITNLL